MAKEIIIGIIITFLCTMITALWNSFIAPFLIENFGERIKIHKNWTTQLDFGSGTLHGVKIEIKKFGYGIKGNLEFTSGRHNGKKYYIVGRFQSNILTFHYYPHDKHSTSQGTATFKRLMDGELLSGHFAYYSWQVFFCRFNNCANGTWIYNISIQLFTTVFYILINGFPKFFTGKTFTLINFFS